jgi:WhiA C-terminal HTH domain/Transcription factor WhiB
MDWQDRGVCVTAIPRPNPDIFSPVPPTKAALATARKFCGQCPVMSTCGAFAERERLTGVWGGDYYHSGRRKDVALECWPPPPAPVPAALTPQAAERERRALRSGGAKANRRRTATATERVCESLARAYSWLIGAEELTPERAEALHLRLRHQDASLAELAELASPPVTKDTMAGRLRRVMALASEVLDAGELA